MTDRALKQLGVKDRVLRSVEVAMEKHALMLQEGPRTNSGYYFDNRDNIRKAKRELQKKVLDR